MDSSGGLAADVPVINIDQAEHERNERIDSE